MLFFMLEILFAFFDGFGKKKVSRFFTKTFTKFIYSVNSRCYHDNKTSDWQDARRDGFCDAGKWGRDRGRRGMRVTLTKKFI